MCNITTFSLQYIHHRMSYLSSSVKWENSTRRNIAKQSLIINRISTIVFSLIWMTNCFTEQTINCLLVIVFPTKSRSMSQLFTQVNKSVTSNNNNHNDFKWASFSAYSVLVMVMQLSSCFYFFMENIQYIWLP